MLGLSDFGVFVCTEHPHFWMEQRPKIWSICEIYIIDWPGVNYSQAPPTFEFHIAALCYKLRMIREIAGFPRKWPIQSGFSISTCPGGKTRAMQGEAGVSYC